MYKVTNKLNQRVKYKGIYFEANETKVLEEKPYSDKFHIENVEQKGKTDSGVSETDKIKGGKK